MRKFIKKLWRIFVSWNIGLFSAIIAFFLADFEIIPSLLFGGGAMFITNFYMKRKEDRLIRSDLAKDEKDYIREQMKIARNKINRIGKSRFKVRSLKAWSDISKVYTIANKILASVEEDPRRFRSAQNFFITKLDSAIEIIEKYIFLASQPVRNNEINETIHNAELALKKLAHSAEREFVDILKEDIEELDIEVKLLQQELVELKGPLLNDGRKESSNHDERVR